MTQQPSKADQIDGHRRERRLFLITLVLFTVVAIGLLLTWFVATRQPLSAPLPTP